MNTYNKLIIVISVCFVLMSSISQAKVRSVKARRDFEQSIAKDSMVVAFFYNTPHKDLIRMYEDVSTHQRYDDADVVFLKINAERKDLSDLARMYGITTMPSFIFFHKGKRLLDNDGKMVMLTGLITRDQLESFIDTYYGDEIDHYIVRKETRKEERIAREDESWKPYFYPRDMFVPGYDPSERSME